MAQYLGESHTEKLKRIREELKKKETQSIVVSSLDEIAWLLNLRGSDIAYNPGPCLTSDCFDCPAVYMTPSQLSVLRLRSR